MDKEKLIKLLKAELAKISETSDNMLFAIEKDKDFPLKLDKQDAIHLAHYADNVKRLLTEELK